MSVNDILTSVLLDSFLCKSCLNNSNGIFLNEDSLTLAYIFSIIFESYENNQRWADTVLVSSGSDLQGLRPQPHILGFLTLETHAWPEKHLKN